MNVDFKILPAAVATAQAETRAEVLGRLADTFAAAYRLDRESILDGLEERESLGSTGFGHGAAIPHCRSTEVSRPTVALLNLKQAVDFAAADAMPVSIVFGLVSPENAGATHLHALAAISRLLRDESTLQALNDAPDGDALFAVLTNQFLRDAA
ncbi:MAG: PTS sugar transporter subunit IIA [Pseudomonadota bacterium]